MDINYSCQLSCSLSIMGKRENEKGEERESNYTTNDDNKLLNDDDDDGDSDDRNTSKH